MEELNSSNHRLFIPMISPLLRRIIFTTAFVVVTLTLKHWTYYFGPAVFETGDYAANALQITGAKHFAEIHGNYSRWGFNHPGPIFFYIYGASEQLFHDSIRVFQSPHQAHAFAGMITQSFFFAFAFATFCQFANSRFFTATLALIAVLHFTCVPEAFTSIWPPNVLIFPMLAFLVASASLAGGQLAFLPFLVLSACFLVHGHVAQPLFVLPITLISLVAYFKARASATVEPHQVKIWYTAAAIIALFLIPLVLDVVKGPQSNFARILNHITTHAGERNTLQQSLGYFLSYFLYLAQPELVVGSRSFAVGTFISDHLVPLSLWAIVLAPGTLALWCSKAPIPHRAFFRSVSAFTITAIILTIQWGRIQEGELYAFNAFFNYALIFLLALPSLVFLTDAFQARVPRWAVYGTWLAVILIIYPKPSAKGDAELQSAPEIPNQVALALHNYPTRPILLTFAHADWPKALGVALALQRAEAPFRIAATNWRFTYWQKNTDPSTESEILAGNGDIWNLTPLEGKRAQYGQPIHGNWGLWRPFYTTLVPTSAKIDFGGSGNSQDYSVLGISEPSSTDYVWSTKQRVDVYFSTFASTADVSIQLDVIPFLGNGQIQSQDVSISLNGHKLLATTVRVADKIEVIVPSKIWAERQSAVLSLYFPQAVSPASLGLSPDPRLLALGIKSITFTQKN